MKVIQICKFSPIKGFAIRIGLTLFNFTASNIGDLQVGGLCFKKEKGIYYKAKGHSYTFGEHLRVNLADWLLKDIPYANNMSFSEEGIGVKKPAFFRNGVIDVSVNLEKNETGGK